MPGRDWSLRVQYTVDAIARIEHYVAGVSYEEFVNDQKTIDAIVRNLEIIGEAGRGIPAAVRDRYPHIPWSLMFGMRNVLAHMYFRVSPPVV